MCKKSTRVKNIRELVIDIIIKKISLFSYILMACCLGACGSNKSQSCCDTSTSCCSNSTPQYVVETSTSILSPFNYLDHLTARFGYKRNDHIISPGLYKINDPSPDSPIFVTSNYTLSFDALRSNLSGISAYILVVNTYGVNVWCASGKGNFSNESLYYAIMGTDLKSIVSPTNRTLILPQLSATGICAHKFEAGTDFKIVFGPVRAEDIPEFIKKYDCRGKSKYMRTIFFNFYDRLILIPVEIVNIIYHTLFIAMACYFIFGTLASLSVLTTIITSTIIYPLLLPYLRKFVSRDVFSLQGFVLGLFFSMIFVIISRFNLLYFYMAFVIAFFALNFSGVTTYGKVSSVTSETLMWLKFFPVLTNRVKKYYSAEASLKLDIDKCQGCQRCIDVCPHDVFVIDPETRKVAIANYDDCMECGACANNCPEEALSVQKGVGCAYAILYSAIMDTPDVRCEC